MDKEEEQKNMDMILELDALYRAIKQNMAEKHSDQGMKAYFIALYMLIGKDLYEYAPSHQAAEELIRETTNAVKEFVLQFG